MDHLRRNGLQKKTNKYNVYKNKYIQVLKIKMSANIVRKKDVGATHKYQTKLDMR